MSAEGIREARRKEKKERVREGRKDRNMKDSARRRKVRGARESGKIGNLSFVLSGVFNST